MTNLTLLSNTITTALTSHDNAIRLEAEQNLINYRNSNPNEFYFNCASIVENQTFSEIARTGAGTVISYLIRQKNPNKNNEYYWDEISHENKEQIKSKYLCVLVSPHEGIMKAAAIILAIIASIELPRGRWQSIIDILAQNCQNQDKAVQNASIITLGYICEEIKKANQKINVLLSEKILGAIIFVAKQNDQNLNKTSIKALEDSLYFLSELMHQQNYRNNVFQVFVNNFKQNKYIQQTYSALFEFVKAASPYLKFYSQIFVDLTDLHLDLKDQVSIMNLEMWDTIGTEYAQKFLNMGQRINAIKKQDNFLQMVSGQVLPSIMKCLLYIDQKQQQENDLVTSATKAIQSFVRVCDMSVLDTITNAVSVIISSPDPIQQQATVPLFSTISDFENRDEVVKMFRSGFDHLFKLLESQNRTVVKSTLTGFVRLSQAFPQVFLENPQFNDVILKTIFSFVTVDLIEIQKIAIHILVNISQGIEKESNQDLKPFLTTMVSYFCQNKMKQEENNQDDINKHVVNIILNILMNINDHSVKTQLIEYMIGQYHQTQKLSSNHNTRQVTDFILSIIHTATLALKQSIGSNHLLNQLCELVNYHVRKYKVQNQGLSIISAMANAFGKSFESRFPIYWQYINSALENPNDLATYKSALSCVGDFARVMEASFVNHAHPILKNLIKNISQSMDRQIKVNILTCMGDLLLCLQQNSQFFVEELLSILQISCSAVIELTNNGSDMEYVQELKSNVIELYSCLAFAVHGSKNGRRLLLEDYSNLATFIVRTCDKSLNPTIEYLKNCVYLIFDLAAFLNKSDGNNNSIVSNVIKSNEIRQLYELLRKHDNSNEIKQMIGYIEDRRTF